MRSFQLRMLYVLTKLCLDTKCSLARIYHRYEAGKKPYQIAAGTIT